MKDFLSNLHYDRLIISGIVLVAFAVVFILLGTAKKKAIGKIYAGEESAKITRAVVVLLRAAVIIFAFLVVSQINGINIGSAIAGFGILSAVIGLALQDLLKDVIMGVHIISDKFYTVGDVVEYNGIEGIVVGFTVAATKIEALNDHSEITVCNRNISEIRKIKDDFFIDLPLSYEEDIEKTETLCKSISEKAKKLEGVKNCIFQGTESFGSSAVLYRFLVSCNPQKKDIIKRKVLFMIQKELSSNKIFIPYEKLDVNLKK